MRQQSFAAVRQQKRVFSITSEQVFPVLLLGWVLLVSPLAAARELIPPDPDDSHQTGAGYWDIHVCNWPDRPPFYLTAFFTERYDELESVEVFLPDGRPLGQLDLNKYLVSQRKDKPPLRILVTHLPLHPQRPEGWYSAHITLKDGSRYLARDYQLMHLMQRAAQQIPAHGAEVPVPKTLRWDPVPGAQRYRVWIRDMWQDGKQIFVSDFLPEPQLELPEDLLQAEGWYAWRIHTRDTHNHVLLGKFNHGSLTDWIEFSTTDEYE